MQLSFITANYNDPNHAEQVVMLLDKYARDPMGGNEPLNPEVAQSLPTKLANFPTAFSVIGYVQNEKGEQKPIALANCFMGFSTFKAKPLINIHDLYVDEDLRGLHIGQRMLAEIERIGQEKGCCKITLEVLEGNTRGQRAYEKFGFRAYSFDDDSGNALFWEKSL